MNWQVRGTELGHSIPQVQVPEAPPQGWEIQHTQRIPFGMPQGISEYQQQLMSG